MPISNQWWALSGAENAPELQGVYELGSAGSEVVYIGRSGNLRRRLTEHKSAPAGSCIGRQASKYRYEVTSSSVSREPALIQEYKLAHGGNLPPCNEATP